MSLFATKYKPTNQKLLFNQECVKQIKNWIKNLQNDFKKVLYLHGTSSSCGKKTTLSLLFKNYNIIYIDSDELRHADNLD